MASSEGLASVEPWSYRQSFNNIDSWLLSDDTDILSKALRSSISTASPSSFFDSTTVFSDLSPPSPFPQTLSNVSFVSDPDISAVAGGGDGTKRKRVPSVSGGKKAKRRPRVSSKKSQTTFITADEDNFRQMVQQITGAKSIGSFIVKPEPYRLAARLPPSCGNLEPTPDTSSFLSNHQQENIVATGIGSVSAPIGSFQQSSATTTAGSAVELDSYPSFPTLESWTLT